MDHLDRSDICFDLIVRMQADDSGDVFSRKKLADGRVFKTIEELNWQTKIIEVTRVL